MSAFSEERIKLLEEQVSALKELLQEERKQKQDLLAKNMKLDLQLAAARELAAASES